MRLSKRMPEFDTLFLFSYYEWQGSGDGIMTNDNLDHSTQALSQQQMHEQLWVAAASGDCGAIRVLAMSGVDIDARNEDGFTAFNIATRHGHSDAAMTILAVREVRFAKTLGEDPATFFETDTAKKTA